MTETLLTLTEAAERLRCSKSTLERLVATGELRSIRVRSRRLVRVADLEAYIREAASL
jgi:excisionase family DNA binding protein